MFLGLAQLIFFFFFFNLGTWKISSFGVKLFLHVLGFLNLLLCAAVLKMPFQNMGKIFCKTVDEQRLGVPK